MEDEGLEEWDADFWDQLLQVEELVLSSRTATTIPPPASTSSPPPPPPPPPSPYPLTYSPPPQLSQRLPHQRKVPHSFPIAEQLQIHASTSECLDIRRERDIKEEHTKSLSSNIEVKHVEALHLKDTNLEHAVRINGHSGISLQCQNASYSNDQISSRLDLATRSCKAVGVQTDKIGASTYLTGYQNTQHTPSEHLLAIWGYSDGQSVGRTLLSKLFASCATDFHVLFGSFCKNASTEMRVGSHAVESSSSVTSKEDMHLVDSSDAEKVSHFYFVLTKIGNGLVELEALIEGLLDLCHVKNVIIVNRSLRILHVILNNLLNMEGRYKKRDCLVVEGLCPSNNAMNIPEFERTNFGGLFSLNRHESHLSHTPSRRKREYWDNHTSKSICHVEWVAVFEVMHQIAVTSTCEHVKLEAVSLMNVILLGTNAYFEREKFGQTVVFDNFSQLLKKEAGSLVQKQAVHLLYSLLNCPKLLAAFCSGCKEEGDSACTVNNDNWGPSGKLIVILDGLADCVACCGSASQDLNLRRNAITVLAFLASSGKSGFEILLSCSPSRKTNFLLLILQVLVSEIDKEAADSSCSPDIFRERTLLIREALIFLNRLVSNPAYSSAVLQALTNDKNIACLTVDIANRLSQTGRRKCWQSDHLDRQMRESEIVNLGQVFRKRVFTYLARRG